VGVAVIDDPVKFAPDHQHRRFNAGDVDAEVWFKAAVADGGEDNFVHILVGDGLFFHHIENRPGHERSVLKGKVQQPVKITSLLGISGLSPSSTKSTNSLSYSKMPAGLNSTAERI